jgi:hypothetical protein
MCWRKLGSDDKEVKKAKAGLEFGHLRNKRPNNTYIDPNLID